MELMKGGGDQTADDQDRRNMRGGSNADIRGAMDCCPFYIPCGGSQCRRSSSCLLKEASLRRHAVLLGELRHLRSLKWASYLDQRRATLPESRTPVSKKQNPC